MYDLVSMRIKPILRKFLSIDLIRIHTKSHIPQAAITRYLNSLDECGKSRLVIRNKFVVK